MATEVLLMADVPELGKAGEVVKVADGYARNYLLPRDLAAAVTPASLRKLEKLRKERAELAKIQLAEAQAKASKLDGVSDLRTSGLRKVKQGMTSIEEVLGCTND